MVDLNPWKVLQEEVRLSTPYFDVRQDLVSHTGQPPRTYHSVRMKHRGVCVLPVDQHGLVTLVGQFRYVIGRYTWELPAGGVPSGAASPPNGSCMQSCPYASAGRTDVQGATG